MFTVVLLRLALLKQLSCAANVDLCQLLQMHYWYQELGCVDSLTILSSYIFNNVSYLFLICHLHWHGLLNFDCMAQTKQEMHIFITFFGRITLTCLSIFTFFLFKSQELKVHSEDTSRKAAKMHHIYQMFFFFLI